MNRFQLTVAVVGILLIGCLARAEQAIRWYKGNTHTHTFWSDGNDFPEMAADWYKRHGYHFLVLSDHNILSRGEKWYDVTRYEAEHQALTKLVRRFGEDHVVSRVENGKTMVKLKTLEQMRRMFEKPGQFIMIEGEEITGDFQHRPAHVNAFNIETLIMPVEGDSMGHTLAEDCRLVKEHQEKIGKPVFCHINHPNWKYSNTAEEMARARLADAFEVINGGGDSYHLGDHLHATTDLMWDIANAIRMKQYGWPPLYGCATDDTHDYHTMGPERSNAGRGWVMVRASELTSDAITQAMLDGDFYCSTGVTLAQVRYDAERKTLSVQVDPMKGHEYRIAFVGTPKDVDLTPTVLDPVVDDRNRAWPVTARYDRRLGMTFSESISRKASYTLSGDELYVRAIVTDLSAEKLEWGPPGDRMQPMAWTQPVGWK